MALKLERSLAVFDAESTGLNPESDRIVELGIVRVDPDGGGFEWNQRFNPGVPIPERTTLIHGITDADVRGCPSFREAAPLIAEMLRGADLAGYSAVRFDFPLLEAEFERAGVEPPWGAEQPVVLDACEVFLHLVPHTLEGAVRFFLGRPHEGAHAALADARATLEVLEAQVERFPVLPRSVRELAVAVQPADAAARVDPQGRLVRESGAVVLNFG